MSLRRPRHLVERQPRGRAFSESIFIVRVGGHRDQYGEDVEVEERFRTLCATAPGAGTAARERELLEGGVELNALRRFWVVEDVDPVIEGGGRGDVIEYLNERFRVHSTQRWGGFSEVLGVRQEDQ